MGELIDQYFVEHLAISKEDAVMVHQRYYKEYGLAIEGLVRYHKVDPLEYNQKVDDALPLDDIISPDPNLRKLLEDIDKTKVRLWLFTNAHITHGLRVVRLLGVDDLFEGITYCDYTQKQLLCKPHPAMFEKAETEAGVISMEDCFFVGKHEPYHLYYARMTKLTGEADDSHLNCRHAQARGWATVHRLEPEDPEPITRAAKYQIRDLEELRGIFPQFFKEKCTHLVKQAQL
ncbi:MAG: hypothetical protein Q9187_002323 [Circinaria calcarea]